MVFEIRGFEVADFDRNASGGDELPFRPNTAFVDLVGDEADVVGSFGIRASFLRKVGEVGFFIDFHRIS
jgi:hypothetical protein